MVVLKIILWVLAFLLFLILMLLVVPFGYMIKGDSTEENMFAFRFTWLFGLIAFSGSYGPAEGMKGKVRLFGLSFKMDMEKPNAGKLKDRIKAGSKKKADEEEKGKKKQRFRLEGFDRETLMYVVDNLKRLLRHVVPDRAEAKLVIGFFDPSYTGVACAAIEILRGLCLHRIQVRYVFYDEVYEGKFFVEGSIFLVYFVYIAIRLLLKRSVRRLVFNG